MKKYIINLTALTSLFLTIVAVQAAPPSAELKVKGKIGVPSCIVVSPDNGIYNLGQISSTQVKPGTTVNTLPSMTKTWTVNCDAVTYLSYTSVDNRLTSVSDTSTARNYGLGNVNRTGKIGFYTAIISNPSVDGQSSSLYYAQGSGAGTANTSAYLVTGYRYGWSNSTAVATAGKTFNADITVAPVLAGTTTMNGPITEDTNIDGSLTMNFAFGI
ncbi:DUF1120 domain-containing protein [Yersinia aldovae]|uniref:Beta-fimbriae major subunit n=1 Tax=Yersinia aldovae TaxID=29483 RepID=A0A0T9TPH3_YERAL|nr:DUF1120 domain-containing protein [Yersinia aldovae]EEP96237.1 hypothetical protein yaldo0001_13020 [Yersinia aldovae ATCC 35236]CNJ56461.1 beta-fimbriae major subunit [Yersinia aldovae]CNK94614.1 beta-fimbriae major subunit [Yersinia aldovae]CNL01851.1 beta-fimbriae major subunit [Yersinia aldovae]